MSRSVGGAEVVTHVLDPIRRSTGTGTSAAARGSPGVLVGAADPSAVHGDEPGVAVPIGRTLDPLGTEPPSGQKPKIQAMVTNAHPKRSPPTLAVITARGTGPRT